MGTKLLQHIRHNTVAYAAIVLVFVLAPTSAYATHLVVRSSDIVNGEVKAPDLGTDSVRSSKILNQTITHADLGIDSVNSDKIANGSIQGEDVADDTISGADVVESTLGQVPTALQGGLGRYGFSGSCDPETTTFVVCSFVQITLENPGRILVQGMVEARDELGDVDSGAGSCRIGTTSGPILASEIELRVFADGNLQGVEHASLVAVTNVLPAGTHSVGVDCNQTGGGFGAITYPRVRVTAVALSAG